jgi:hypothetical protein
MDTQVNAYIEKQPSPQKEILQELRVIFREAIPNCKEEMRWGVITFVSGKFYIAAMKTCVHVGFTIAGLKSDEVALFEGTGKTMRHIKIAALEGIDTLSLVNMIKLVNEKATCKPC